MLIMSKANTSKKLRVPSALLLVVCLISTLVPWLALPTPVKSAPVVEVIVDNAQANNTGLSAVIRETGDGSGTWGLTTTNVKAYKSGYFTLNRTADISVSSGVYCKWTPEIPETGYYDVYLSWLPHTNRVDAAPVEVKHADGLDATRTVNQKTTGTIVPETVTYGANTVSWYKIGNYRLTAGTDNYILLRGDDTGYTFFDAARFIKTEPPAEKPSEAPGPIILDNNNAANGDRGTFEYNGSTMVLEENGSAYLGAAYRDDLLRDDPEAFGKWIPNIPIPGNYEIYLTWPASSGAADMAPIEVSYDGGNDTTKRANQKSTSGAQYVNGKLWYRIGEYKLAAGNSNYIKLKGDDQETTYYDAAMFVYKSSATGSDNIPLSGRIIDNSSAYFSTTGEWSRITVTEKCYGGNYLQVASSVPDKNNTATWRIPEDLTAGEYDLYMLWSEAADRPDAAPLEIKFDYGLDTAKTVNQQVYGSRDGWGLLGTYAFTPGYSQYIRIKGSDQGTTAADAILLTLKKESPTPLPISVPNPGVIMPKETGEEVIIDNSNTTYFSTSGTWETSNVGEGFYGADYKIAFNGTASSTRVATWKTPDFAVRGRYDIYMRWTAGPDRPDAAPVSIKSNDEMEVYNVGGSNYRIDASSFLNQQESDGWNLLGTYTFYKDANGVIKLFGSDEGALVADAIKIVLREKQELPSYDSPRVPLVPIKVEMSQGSNGNWSLTRGGEPYYIKGVCGIEEIDLAAEAGANAARTYGINGLNGWEVLDRAYEKGIGVMIGLSLTQNTYMDYSNNTNKLKIADQLETWKKIVDQYKNYPAVIAWAVGNEVDKGNAYCYYHINELAKYIHDTDPSHPTVAVLAGSSIDKITWVRTLAPEIDIIALNSYINIGNIRKNIETAGWTKPYIVSEWGNDASYEVPKVNTTVPVEADSDAKATIIRNRYEKYILGESDKCIGSFVFKLAEVVGNTHTWYNLILEGDKKTPMMDEMTYVWKSVYAENRAPRVTKLSVNGIVLSPQASSTDLVPEQVFLKYPDNMPLNVVFSPGSKCEAVVNVFDPDGDEMKFVWELRVEYVSEVTSKPGQRVPELIYEVDPDNNANISFYTPTKPGDYRLFLKIYDGNKNVGTANFPFRVQ